jgi:hypothetical protein
MCDGHHPNPHLRDRIAVARKHIARLEKAQDFNVAEGAKDAARIAALEKERAELKRSADNAYEHADLEEAWDVVDDCRNLKPSGGEESGKQDRPMSSGVPVTASKLPEGKPKKCNTCLYTNNPIYHLPCRRCETRTTDKTDKDEWRQDPNKPDQGYIEGRISPD